MMSIWSDIWELFFPRYCVLCGKRLLKEEECLCVKCLMELPRTRIFQEERKGLEMEFWGKLPIERANAFFYYSKGNDVRRLLYELKYYGNSALGVFMGKCMAMELQPLGFFEGVDCIVPVPLHEKKKRKRGYNQSEKLAEGLSSVTGIPVHDKLVVRSQYTDTQTRKGRYERWMNVKDVFECVSVSGLEGKHILLVDDVMTTGATIVACADAFSKVSCLRISVLTLAIASDV